MKIIQFIQPGQEHGYVSGINWWTGTHMRKYMQTSGLYLSSLKGNVKKSEELYFWGEWEAESNINFIEKPIENGPKYIFNPYYKLPFIKNAANTDPFMFGNQFYYCFCKQGHYSALRNFNRGDLILFGSCKQKKFVLDSVFVIKNKIPYELDYSKVKANDSNQIFFDVSILPLLELGKCTEPLEITKKGKCYKPVLSEKELMSIPVKGVDEYYIYEAAMYEDRNEFDGMFSYAPCLTDKNGKLGFERPNIILPDNIAQGLTQGLKISDVQNSKEIWSQLTEIVLKNNLSLMVENELPKKID